MTVSSSEAICAFIPPFLRYLRDGVAKVNLSTARFQTLQALAGGKVLTMVELAERLSVTKRNVTTLIDGLERNGLAKRSPHPTDRRSKRVQLTEIGETVFLQAAEVQRDHIDNLLGLLEPEQRQTLATGLALLTDAMTKNQIER
ncbi:MAG: MarR family winged helix-turn-helix transcriptional regulator [Pseudomonadota bacterium]